MCVVAKGGKAAWVVPTHGVPQVLLTFLINTHRHTRRPCETNILTEMGRRWGVSSLANWVTSDVGPGSAQDSFGMPKQDLRKPQPLLESMSPHQPPTHRPPRRLWRHMLTLNHQTVVYRGQQIPWVFKLWPNGEK